MKDVAKLITQNCHYCERPPSNTADKGVNYYGVKFQGIDRKDNTKGYTLANVVPCCIQCNRIKSNALTYEEMKVVAIALAVFRRLLSLR